MDIYTDGSGDNGQVNGISGYCVICKDPAGDKVEHKVFRHPFTSNEMEWYAMVRSIGLASPGDVIHSDSQLVVNQVNRRWRIKEARLAEYAARAFKLLADKPGVKIIWIPREKNDAGVYLETIGNRVTPDMISPIPEEELKHSKNFLR